MQELTDFQKETMQGLGGHDMGAILGVHPFKTVHDVYMEKVEGRFSIEMTKPMQRGIYLEPSLVQYACDELQLRARECPVQVHPEFKFIRGHPDRFLMDPDSGSGFEPVALLEAKTTRLKADWGEEGTDSIPDFILIQINTYLELTGLSVAWIPADVAYELRLYKAERNQDVIDAILENGARFWNDHILKKVPPAVDGSDNAGDMLKALYAKDTGLEIASDEKIEEMYAEYHQARLVEASAAKDLELRKQLLQKEMGAASVLQGDDWRITWKAHDTTTIDRKAILAEMTNPPKRLIKKHTQTSTVRRFNPPRLK